MENIQDYWMEPFSTLVELCKIKSHENIILLKETLSRELNVTLLEKAFKQNGLKYTVIQILSKSSLIDPIIKSTGASNILDGNDHYLQKLMGSNVILIYQKKV